MTTITALPTPPTTTDPTNFNTRANAFVQALPTFVTETNTLAGEVITNRDAAAASNTSAAGQVTAAQAQVALATTQANNAAASAAAAAATTGVSIWTNTTYNIGDLRFSGVNSLTYRNRTGADNVNTDPALDPTNWALVIPVNSGSLIYSYDTFGGL